MKYIFRWILALSLVVCLFVASICIVGAFVLCSLGYGFGCGFPITFSSTFWAGISVITVMTAIQANRDEKDVRRTVQSRPPRRISTQLSLVE